MAGYKPKGWHTVTPRLIVDDVAEMVRFLRKTFRATGKYQRDRPSIMSIGECKLMISDAAIRGKLNAFLYVYVDNVEKTYARALKQGAVSVEAPMDLPYGDRRAMVKDRWGNLWQIAKYQGP